MWQDDDVINYVDEVIDEKSVFLGKKINYIRWCGQKDH